jgi:molecular chaperone DnaK (HSP70)
MQLGIDFGTTRTVVAIVDRGNYPVVDFTDPAGDSIPFLPSLIAARGDELRFGFDAQAVAGDRTFVLLPSFKRLLSSAQAGPSQTVDLGGRPFLVAELVRGYLAYVRTSLATSSNVRRTFGKASAGAPRAVVGVPANAHGAQRLVTLDAFRGAGFDVRAMLNEPSAAGFEYTHRHRTTLSSRRDSVVVYDLGGGTFDASLVRMVGAHHAVLATAGLGRLGGDDFDAVLARAALGAVGLTLEGLPPHAAQALLAQCRDAKERLHPNSRKIALDLESALGKDAPSAEVSVKVADYYDACAPLVEETIVAMMPVLSRAKDEETSAPTDVDLADIAGLYVVGGASLLPVIARTLRERFGRRVHRSPYPSAAVAIGLAIAADDSAGFALSDRYARTFGVFREAEGGQRITFDPIFTEGTLLPAPSTPLTRTRSYRAAHNVGHFRFFECSAVEQDGRPRGDMAVYGDVYFPFDARLANAKDLGGVAIERTTEGGPRIVESYSLHDSGIVDVRIRNVDTGYERAFRLGA